jgi:hypothetical protein
MPVVTEKGKYVVRIHWTGYSQSWNEICATAIEHFGLPGGRYTTDVCENSMDFIFKKETDAIWFSLRTE